jgi:energy-converting hydrogenase Eha subunit C
LSNATSIINIVSVGFIVVLCAKECCDVAFEKTSIINIVSVGFIVVLCAKECCDVAFEKNLVGA